MRKFTLLGLGLATLLTSGIVVADEKEKKETGKPGAEEKQPERPRRGFGGPGGPGFGGRPQPGQILPGFMQDQLKLTDEQKKKLDALQKEIDEKLGKLLTEDQKKQLKEMRERGGRGFGGFPGGGGGGGGRPGGRPGAERPPAEKK